VTAYFAIVAKLQRGYNLVRDLVEAKSQVDQIPDVVGFL
jgi:hypothetical protein